MTAEFMCVLCIGALFSVLAQRLPCSMFSLSLSLFFFLSLTLTHTHIAHPLFIVQRAPKGNKNVAVDCHLTFLSFWFLLSFFYFCYRSSLLLLLIKICFCSYFYSICAFYFSLFHFLLLYSISLDDIFGARLLQNLSSCISFLLTVGRHPCSFLQSFRLLRRPFQMHARTHERPSTILCLVVNAHFIPTEMDLGLVLVLSRLKKIICHDADTNRSLN